jgi:hypothetical protein
MYGLQQEMRLYASSILRNIDSPSGVLLDHGSVQTLPYTSDNPCLLRADRRLQCQV